MTPARPARRSPAFAGLALAIAAVAAARATPATAVAPSGIDLGVSMMSYQLDRLSGSETGEPSTLGTSFYHLDLQAHLPVFSKKLLLSPVLRYMPESLSAVDAPDDGSKTSLMLFGLPVVGIIGSHGYLGGGVGLMRYSIKGSGGTKEMPNGHSTTTFSLPSRTVTTTTMYGSIGGGFIAGRLSGGLELLLHGLGSSERRSMSGLLSIGFQVMSL